MHWTNYEIDNADKDSYISIEHFGQDHWSVFAYLETRTVDNNGIIDNRRMRCNSRLHREFTHITSFNTLQCGKDHPTRLKNKQIQDKHDDWSCLEDMVAAGLLRAYWRVVRPDDVFGNSEGRIELTTLGQRVAAQLRQHKANGGKWSNFEIDV